MWGRLMRLEEEKDIIAMDNFFKAIEEGNRWTQFFLMNN